MAKPKGLEGKGEKPACPRSLWGVPKAASRMTSLVDDKQLRFGRWSDHFRPSDRVPRHGWRIQLGTVDLPKHASHIEQEGEHGGAAPNERFDDLMPRH